MAQDHQSKFCHKEMDLLVHKNQEYQLYIFKEEIQNEITKVSSCLIDQWHKEQVD